MTKKDLKVTKKEIEELKKKLEELLAKIPDVPTQDEAEEYTDESSSSEYVEDVYSEDPSSY